LETIFTIIQTPTGVPTCHRFVLDCNHLVEPLDDAPRAYLDNWLLIYIAYDRHKKVLEICFNHGTRYQWRNVPLRTALALVRSADPAQHLKENIERKYRFAQVRGRYYTEWMILMGMARQSDPSKERRNRPSF
jgi:KTSC domain-containing protein